MTTTKAESSITYEHERATTLPRASLEEQAPPPLDALLRYLGGFALSTTSRFLVYPIVYKIAGIVVSTFCNSRTSYRSTASEGIEDDLTWIAGQQDELAYLHDILGVRVVLYFGVRPIIEERAVEIRVWVGISVPRIVHPYIAFTLDVYAFEESRLALGAEYHILCIVLEGAYCLLTTSFRTSDKQILENKLLLERRNEDIEVECWSIDVDMPPRFQDAI